MKHAAQFNQGGAAPTITIVNLATVALGVDLDRMLAALQKFLDRDFAPVWGASAKLVKGDSIPAGSWAIALMDDADEAGFLGYHDLTKNGLPLSKVFVKTLLKAGEKVSTTVCHELAEMLIDPAVNMWADGGKGVFYAVEMCDACEEETYLIDGVTMSDFVHPAFFEPFHKPGSVQFDHLKKITKPFQTLPGGYQITMTGGKQGQIFGSRQKAERFQLEDRRLHRSDHRWRLHQAGLAEIA